MENKPYYELNNAEFLIWLNNLITIIIANRANLPITQAQIDALVARRDSHETKLNKQLAAERAAESATRDITDDRVLSNAEVSFINTTFKIDKSIPRELLIEMGINPNEGRTSPAPNQPLDLTVAPNAAGFNELRWNRSDNKPNTIFVIEAQIGDAPDWTYVFSTSEAKYTHEGQKPGVQVAYRVKATRKGESSPYSSVAVAYFKG